MRSCVARQEPYIPGALSILQGTVPGRVRGSGHVVPTYLRRELRDRVLQRRLRLRAFVCRRVRSSRRSYSAKAEYPVRRGFPVYRKCAGILDHPLSRVMTTEYGITLRDGGECRVLLLLWKHKKRPCAPQRWWRAMRWAASAAPPRRRLSRCADCRLKSPLARLSPATRRSAARSIPFP